MILKRIAVHSASLIDRLAPYVWAIRDQWVEKPVCDGLRRDLFELDFLLQGTGLEVPTEMEPAADDRFLIAGVRVDSGGRVRCDDKWVVNLGRIRHALSGYLPSARRDPPPALNELLAKVGRVVAEKKPPAGRPRKFHVPPEIEEAILKIRAAEPRLSYVETAERVGRGVTAKMVEKVMNRKHKAESNRRRRSAQPRQPE